MDIKEIQEQAYKKGFADGQATLGAEFMCKKTVSYEDVNTKYLEFPDGLRLIFREGEYVGWYVCNAVPDGKDTDVPDNNVGNKWIPVTERLPEKHKKVLTVSDNGNIDVDWVDKFGVWIGDIVSFDEVTHWMPLPEPPKGE